MISCSPVVASMTPVLSSASLPEAPPAARHPGVSVNGGAGGGLYIGTAGRKPSLRFVETLRAKPVPRVSTIKGDSQKCPSRAGLMFPHSAELTAAMFD